VERSSATRASGHKRTSSLVLVRMLNLRRAAQTGVNMIDVNFCRHGGALYGFSRRNCHDHVTRHCRYLLAEKGREIIHLKHLLSI
jgi:hypothetical protein